MYICKHFKLFELLPEHIYRKLEAAGELWKGWMILDERELRTCDIFREVFGETYVNTWHPDLKNVFTQVFRWSGYRDHTCYEGADYGQHRFGRATDKHPVLLTGEEATEYIIKHPEKFPFVQRIESPKLTPGWCHTDCGNNIRILNGIFVIE